jgi:hypothetical protein
LGGQLCTVSSPIWASKATRLNSFNAKSAKILKSSIRPL